MIEPAELSAIQTRVADYFARIYRPGADQFHGITYLDENPATGTIAFSGPVFLAEGGFPVTRIGVLEKGDPAPRLIATGSHNDSDPRWSPDGRMLAFLSDRGRGPGNMQLWLADADDLADPRPGPVLAGEAVEAIVWSFDGTRILVQSADSGAHAAGSAPTAQVGHADDAARPSWAPRVETGAHGNLWRRARILRLADGALTGIGAEGQNVWEAAWLGDDMVAAIISSSPTEGGWYDSELAIAPASGGAFRRVAAPGIALSRVAGSPDGRHVAVIEGRFHRTVQLGTLKIYDRETGIATEPDIGAQASLLVWRDSNRLFFAGYDSPQTVAGTYDLAAASTDIHWRSSGTAGRKVPYAAPAGRSAVLVPGHAIDRYSHIARIGEDGIEKPIFDAAPATLAPLMERLAPATALSWRGAEGLEIHGYLAMPAGISRPPLVLFIHGGPSHLFRDSWSFDNPAIGLLLSAGYAVLATNPRGSSGRGRDFAEGVFGDWGGKDAEDILAGLDHVIANHDVDPDRLFVTGISYGGYMTSWLITQTSRFKAACAGAPVTDMRSQFFTAYHPEFLSLYTGGDAYTVGDIFDRRSPLRHANKVTTPALVIAGGIDQTTPDSQALQFHRALVMNGVPSELAIYPEEGHAVNRYEAQIDQGVRILRWFKTWERHNGGANL